MVTRDLSAGGEDAEATLSPWGEERMEEAARLWGQDRGSHLPFVSRRQEAELCPFPEKWQWKPRAGTVNRDGEW